MTKKTAIKFKQVSCIIKLRDYIIRLRLWPRWLSQNGLYLFAPV